MRPGELQDRVILVTGGSRGIGREIVLGALERGGRVAFCYRQSQEDAEQVLEAARQAGGRDRVVAVRADVSNEQDVDAFFETALVTFGRIDVLVNNAGISRPGVVPMITVDEWDRVLATNLTGAFLASRRAVQEFVRQGDGGRIITMGSVMQNGAPCNASYAASKGGLVGLSQAIDDEYGRAGISCFLLMAGSAETCLTVDAPAFLARMADTTPLKRLAKIGEIAAVALSLASDRARAMRSGSVVDVSGGAPDPIVQEGPATNYANQAD